MNCRREHECLNTRKLQVKWMWGSMPAGPRSRLRRAAGAAPPWGWSPRLQSCLSSFGQATEAKLLASGGLQGAGSYMQ
jgi:hypothetical protein